MSCGLMPRESHSEKAARAPLVTGILDSAVHGGWQQRVIFEVVDGVCRDVPLRNLELRFSFENDTC